MCIVLQITTESNFHPSVPNFHENMNNSYVNQQSATNQVNIFKVD